MLGVLDGIGKPGLVVRRYPAWTSVYSAAPDLPSWLLREIARKAGVHVYSDHDEALYANHSFLGLHTRDAGPRTIRFPQQTDVYDLFAERQVAKAADEITVDFPAHKTAFYFLGSEDEWKGKRGRD